MDFDPIAVSKLNERKIVAAGCAASSLLSELKLRSIVENARQMSKVNSSPPYLNVPAFSSLTTQQWLDMQILDE